jgi:hypothetical protein
MPAMSLVAAWWSSRSSIAAAVIGSSEILARCISFDLRMNVPLVESAITRAVKILGPRGIVE